MILLKSFFLQALPFVLLGTYALSIPTGPITEEVGTAGVSSGSSDVQGLALAMPEKRCEWSDRVAGGIPCDYFSVVFDGSWSIWGANTKRNVYISASNGDKQYGDAYDNTWIKYAGLFLNTPTSTMCARYGLQMRCLIPQRP